MSASSPARVATIIAACCLIAAEAFAQAYPSRPIRYVVPYPPGGGADFVARAVTQHLGELLGQPIVIDNRGGAAGNLGAEIVAKAPPDGYTLLGTPDNIFVLNPSLYRKMPFEFLKDFSAVALVGWFGSVLVVHPTVQVNSVKELIVLAKAKPGALSFGTAGVGSPTHHSSELFKAMAGVDMLHVPYKGGGPAVLDLVGGRLQLMFASVPSVQAFIKEGRLRALAVTSAKRDSLVPELPTIAEAGLPGYESITRNAVYVPKGTDPKIISRLNTEVGKVVAMPIFRKQMANIGVEVATSSPQELEKLVIEQKAIWEKLAKAAGIKPE
jgi:tripartite-type tricarboxylate transporter receptor subunit TctC